MRSLLLCLVLIGMAGCSNVQPWVLPYEREALADPIMSLSRVPLIDQYRQHVYDVRQAAKTASMNQGGGCGCN
ncbi:MAG: DUF4266 domain-containing protein [Gammaproteobacteria bacterium]